MMSMYSEYSKIIHFDELKDPTDAWQLIERIGQGTYGEVHIAQSKTTGEIQARRAGVEGKERMEKFT